MSDNSGDTQAVYRKIGRHLGWVIMAVGILVLMSWWLDIEVGKSVFLGFASMKFNTALCFVVSGWLLYRQLPRDHISPGSPASRLGAASIIAVSSLTLVEYASGWNLGIDNLMVLDTDTDPAEFPGRMSIVTATCFLLTGLALFAATLQSLRCLILCQALALLVVFTGFTALTGYLYGVEQFRLFAFSTLALHTSVLFVLLGAGLLCIRADQGLMGPATSARIGGRSLRRLLPISCLTPIVTGALSLWGLHSGLYSAEFGFALDSLSSIVILTAVIFLGAHALNLEEQRFRIAIDAAPVSIIMVDQKGTIRLTNQLAQSTFRCDAGALLGQSIEELIPEHHRQTHIGEREQFMRHPERRSMGMVRELFARRKDGTEFPAEIALNPVAMANGRYVLAAILDITERVEANRKIQHLNRMHRVLSGINSLIVRASDRDTLCQEATRIAVEDGEMTTALIVRRNKTTDTLEVWHGHTAEKQRHSGTFSVDDERAIRSCMGSSNVVIHDDLEQPTEEEYSRGLAEQNARAMACFPLTSEENELDAALVLYHAASFAFDTSEIELLREVAGDISFALSNLDRHDRLEYLTYYDSITGLPNRFLMGDRVHQAMLQATDQRSEISLLFLDIDRFMKINESLGHAAGDEVLRLVAQSILACLDDSVTVSRWSGDEFLVLLPGHDATKAAQIAHQIAGIFEEPIVLEEGHELFISCSMGIAEYPRDGNSIDTLVKSASTAMAVIKEYGGNDYRHFKHEVDDSGADSLTMETALRQALNEEQFHLVFQPQIDLASERVVGFETLLRWQHPELGMVPPDTFIPLAEDTGLIIPIGEWVLRTACHLARDLKAQSIAVNLSARQFHQRDLVSLVAGILEETGMPAQTLELEITESALMFDMEAAVITMSRLGKLGVRISLDDFGTGYSSLSYLQRFPIDTIKIDKSFVSGMQTDAGSSAIVNAMIAMSHSLGLQVIAEGVETEAQRDSLRERGCDQAQGYLFSRPLPFEQVVNGPDART
ncbi:sensor domain-containing protein [Halomonas aquatica]|uniref:EAL domain-containing protein n=1 Tax=Halomonas aquatica TaxID=3151123 RepID=A0ABV1NDK4_9GAMM